MIDMVVHRHKMRETLARLCRLLTSTEKAVTQRKRSVTAKHEDRGYLNGSVVDGQTIETLARRGSDAMEREPVEDNERFEVRPKTARHDQEAKPLPRPGSRDGARN